MEKFVLELIKENNRVIIPNFGAFIISKENGINILFNNFLSFNDGLLVNYIAEKKGLDTVVATEEVFTYVDNLKKQLDETGIYEIEGLGVFKKDDSGILRFSKDRNFVDLYNQEPTSNTESSLDQKTESPKNEEKISLEDKNTETTQKDLLDLDSSEEIENIEPSVNDIDSISNEPILTIDKEEEEDETTSSEENKDDNFVKKEDKEASITTETTVDSDSVEKHDNKESNSYSTSAVENEPTIKDKPIVQKTTDSNKKPTPQKTQVSKKKSQNKNAIVLLVLLLVVIVGIASYILFIQNPAKEKAQKHIQEIKIEKQKTIVTDTLPKVTQEQVPVEEPQEPVEEEPAIVKNEYHVIIGGFKEEQNAVNLVEKFKNKGYEKSQIIPKGNLFLVSIDSDASYQKMEQSQQNILENEHIDSWMYRVK